LLGRVCPSTAHPTHFTAYHMILKKQCCKYH